MANIKLPKSRASTSEQAREYRQRGHDNALFFALLIGLDNDYRNDPKAKKDVIDPSGDAHSVKGGLKKWQIFLYSLKRFKNDSIFQAMNGLGQLIVDCINSFPQTFEEYKKDKAKYKELLKPSMIKIAEKLQDKHRLQAFISKSMFNGGEVNYLTVYDNGKFHIFWSKEVEKLMADKLTVTNSKARTLTQFPDQKVVFKYNDATLGELEMRNDSQIHYKEVRFNMLKPKTMDFLFENITDKRTFHEKIIIYGEAVKHFGKWKKG